MSVNPFTERYEEIELFGKPALYTILRLDKRTVPNPLNVYDIRHSSDGEPASIENVVIVNHSASVITIDPIKFDGTSISGSLYKRMTSDDMNFIGEHTTLAEFMEKHNITKRTQEISEEQRFIELYRCSCGTLKGAQFEGETCPLCKTTIKKWQ